MISAEEIKALMEKDECGLLPCPFCNGLEEIVLKANCTSPVINRPQNVISFDITHWCKGDGLPRKRIHVTSANKEEAVLAWNTRAYTPALSTLQTLLKQAAEEFKGATEYMISAGYDKFDESEPEYQMLKCHKRTLAAITPYLTKEGE